MKYDNEAVSAAKYIREIAGGKRIETEQEVSLFRDGKEVTFGTYDAYCEGHLFDLKTGREQRYYLPQMAVYAAAICQRDGIEKIECHLIYSYLKKIDKFTLTREEAERIAFGIIDSVDDPTRMPAPCDYCNWCEHKADCSALNTLSLTVANRVDMLGKYRVSEIGDPLIMGQYRIVADAVETWAKEVKAKCNEFDEIAGYSKSSRRGKKQIKDITGALIGSGLPADKFVRACTVSFPKLVKEFADYKGVSEKEANKDLSNLIASVTKEGHPVTYWRKEK